MKKCRIRSVSRLHITLIDLNASWGVIDGGAGVILDKPFFEIEIYKDPSLNTDEIRLPDSNEEILEIVSRCLERIREYIVDTSNRYSYYTINLKKIYPPHIGLGATTQLCMSIATGIWILEYDETPDHLLIARIIRRGGTSGIGVHGFALGGFIVDGGHLKDVEKKDFLPSDYSVSPPPPILVREEIPETWRFVLIRPRRINKRFFGSRELEVFKNNTPLNINEVYEVSYHVLMGLLNSIKRRDIYRFRRHLRRIQDIGFKSIEWRIQADEVKRIAEYLDRSGVGYGLSSMGPTVFIPIELDEEQRITRILESLGNEYLIDVVEGRNRGYEAEC
ncbi:MAG: beta-ribofuranosylaminobenzene 5'-phosphate synthase family protein [Sulfolobales archaeon]